MKLHKNVIILFNIKFNNIYKFNKSNIYTNYSYNYINFNVNIYNNTSIYKNINYNIKLHALSKDI